MMLTMRALCGAPVTGTEAGPAPLPVSDGYGRTRFDAIESSRLGKACHPKVLAPLRRGFLLAYADWSIVNADPSQ